MASSSSWNSVSVEDPSNPYYLHHEDSPGSSLVSEVFDGENYYTCSRLIVIALKAKNKIGFIEGTLSKPSSASDPLSQAWTRCNAMVFSWILHSISNEIAASVISMNAAEEMWTDLKVLQYFQNNGPRIFFQLKRATASLSQDQASVSRIRGQILQPDPLPPFNKVFSLVLKEERLTEIATAGSLNLDPASAALLTKPVPLCLNLDLVK